MLKISETTYLVFLIALLFASHVLTGCKQEPPGPPIGFPGAKEDK